MNTINIKALSEQVSKLSSSGGSGLPDVTAADNGKVLGVVKGSWNKMDAPSGGVNYSTTEQNTGLKWIDGKDIFQKTVTFENLSVISTPVVVYELQTGESFLFTYGYFTESGKTYSFPDTGLRVVVTENNEITFKTEQGATWDISTGAITSYYTKTPVTKATKKKTTK